MQHFVEILYVEDRVQFAVVEAVSDALLDLPAWLSWTDAGVVDGLVDFGMLDLLVYRVEREEQRIYHDERIVLDLIGIVAWHLGLVLANFFQQLNDILSDLHIVLVVLVIYDLLDDIVERTDFKAVVGCEEVVAELEVGWDMVEFFALHEKRKLAGNRQQRLTYTKLVLS